MGSALVWLFWCPIVCGSSILVRSATRMASRAQLEASVENLRGRCLSGPYRRAISHGAQHSWSRGIQSLGQWRRYHGGVGGAASGGGVFFESGLNPRGQTSDRCIVRGGWYTPVTRPHARRCVRRASVKPFLGRSRCSVLGAPPPACILFDVIDGARKGALTGMTRLINTVPLRLPGFVFPEFRRSCVTFNAIGLLNYCLELPGAPRAPRSQPFGACSGAKNSHCSWRQSG